jgi:hypothetical protein
MFRVLQCIFFFVIILTITSCDCVQRAEGIVLDEETRLPVKQVNIQTRRESLVYSDENGQFEYSAISGGLFGCPDLQLNFSKPGYNSLRIILDSFTINDTIYLRRTGK